MKNKVLNILLMIIISFCILPSVVYARNVTIKNTTIWGDYVKKNPGFMEYANVYYYTKDYGRRETKYIASFVNTSDNQQVFCVEPGASFPSNNSYSYEETTSIPSLYKSSWNSRFKNSSVQEDLKKVLSCWNSYSANGNNYYSIASAQAVVWELVTGERSSINATDILGGDYSTSYYSGNVGACYDNNASSVSNKCSLYSRIKARGAIYSSYKSLLRCAARFNISAPSWAGSTSGTSKKQELTSYNDSTQTFSRTFAHGSKIAPDLFRYYTYQINGKNADCVKGATVDGITCKCNNAQCTFSTTNEIPSNKAIPVVLKYTYKDDGSKRLNTFATKYYKKSNYQNLMQGSTSKAFYLSLYTGEKPKYQVKITKIDSESSKPIEGVKFDIFTDKAATAKNKVGTTTATDKNGVATYSNLTKIGTYYIREANTPGGFKTNGEIYPITVSASHTVKNKAYATLTIKNDPIHLKMLKYTIDEEGNRAKLTGDSCQVKTCSDEQDRENGPIFIITKDNKRVCVKENKDSKGNVIDGKYTYDSLSETCATGTTDRIKTCNGEFDISNILEGKYEVKEVATSCGHTLPSNPSKEVTVSPGKDQTVTMENGVTGVVFHKVNENGNLITGGKFSLQKKENGVYKDVLLTHVKGIIYKYDSTVKIESNNSTYLLETFDTGMLNVVGLPAGEYRFVEKEAPVGFSIIKDKDSTATFTVSDKAKDDYYNVQLINHKEKTTGSYDSAELVVTIITGRKVINYVLLIGGLVVILALLIFLRKKFKK